MLNNAPESPMNVALGLETLDGASSRSRKKARRMWAGILPFRVSE